MKKRNQNQSLSPDVRDFINLIRQQSVQNTTLRLDHETFLRTFKGKETPDAELIEDYNLNHNEQAFDELYKRHKSKMLAYLYGILHNWEDAKDVLQNSWEIVVQYFNKQLYKEEQDFAGWFKGICYHRASEWLREKRRFFYGNGQLPDRPDPSFNADEHLENKQCETLLHHGMDRLTDTERQIVTLRIYREMNFYEIAVMRSITASAARGMYCKAIKKLKKAIY